MEKECKRCKWLDNFYMCFNKDSEFFNKPRESHDVCAKFVEKQNIDVLDTDTFKIF